MQVTDELLKELEAQHQGFVDKPGTSRGQYADSKTILALVAEIRRLRNVVEAAKEWQEIHYDVRCISNRAKKTEDADQKLMDALAALDETQHG